MVPIAQYPLDQSTEYTSPRVHSTFSIAPRTDDAATRFCPDPLEMRANWNCQTNGSSAEIWMAPNRNWIDTVEMTCTMRPQRIHLCKKRKTKELNVFMSSTASFRTYFALPKTCFSTPPSTPFKLNITSCASKSKRQPSIEPPCHEGKSCVSDFALCQINRRHPSNAIEYGSSPMPYPSCTNEIERKKEKKESRNYTALNVFRDVSPNGAHDSSSMRPNWHFVVGTHG